MHGCKYAVSGLSEPGPTVRLFEEHLRRMARPIGPKASGRPLSGIFMTEQVPIPVCAERRCEIGRAVIGARTRHHLIVQWVLTIRPHYEGSRSRGSPFPRCCQADTRSLVGCVRAHRNHVARSSTNPAAPHFPTPPRSHATPLTTSQRPKLKTRRTLPSKPRRERKWILEKKGLPGGSCWRRLHWWP